MSDIRSETLRNVSRTLIPILFLLYLFNYIDRVNIGYAALQMNQDLGFSPATFGLGAGLLFVGYVAFGIPSNYLLQWLGGRVWLSTLAIIWGVVASANALISDERIFYLMRFLLGVTEAGFVPGMLLYVARWYPQSERARIVATLYMATAISVVVAGPISGAIMQLDGVFGIAGWRWILLLQGLPPICLGLFALKWLPEKPESAPLLTKDQRAWLASELAAGEMEQADRGFSNFRQALRAPIIWIFGLIYFLLGVGFFSVMIWLPLVIKQISGLTPTQVSFVSAIPFLCAAACMMLYGRHSDRTEERQWHLVLAFLVGFVGLTISAWSTDATWSFAAICVAAIGLWSATGVFWPMPTALLSGEAAAGGLALINSVGILGGFVGPYLVGFIRSISSDFSTALYCMAAAQLLAAILASQLHRVGPGREADAKPASPNEAPPERSPESMECRS